MIRRIVCWAAIAICGMALSACADQNDDDSLPPPHLASPVISRMAAPPAAWRPTALGQITPSFPQRAAQPASATAVPAGWIPNVPANHWTWIIIHHSDSTFGSAALIDSWHRARGFDELGYHFVIGNGTNSGDGQIEIGPRWTKQKWGAHDNALDNRYNKQGIGICLVGDFDKQFPTAAQKRSLVRLVVYLMKTYHITPDHVLGHGDTKVTNCPGKNLHVSEIRADAVRILAEGNEPTDALAKRNEK